MRVLRTSLYVDPYTPPVLAVMRDGDSGDSLESSRIQLVELTTDSLLICEIFNMPNDTIERATRVAFQRAQERDHIEKHMAMMYFWLADLFPKGKPEAVINMDEPTPMSADDMRYVLDRLIQHPHYNDFTILGIAQDGTQVRVERGALA